MASDLSWFQRLRGVLAKEAGAEPVALGRYTVERRLGEGATAVIYRGRDEALGRPVAIKVLRPSFAIADAARERFQREALATARLAHPNVIAVHDIGE